MPAKARTSTAWERGRAGQPPPPRGTLHDTYDLAAYDQGRAERDAQQPPPPPLTRAPATPAKAPQAPPWPTKQNSLTPVSSAPTPAAPATSGPSWLSKPIGGGDGTGLLMSFLAYALALNFIREGPAGVRAWFAAKFLNKVKGEQTAKPPPFYDGHTPGHQLPLIPGLTPGPARPAPRPGQLPTIPGLTP